MRSQCYIGPQPKKESDFMEIAIKGTPKEIAGFVSELQSQHKIAPLTEEEFTHLMKKHLEHRQKLKF